MNTKKIKLIHSDVQRPFEAIDLKLEPHCQKGKDFYRLVARLRNTSGQTIRDPSFSVALLTRMGFVSLTIVNEGPESPLARFDEWRDGDIWSFLTETVELDPASFAQCTHCDIRFHGETPQPPF